MLFGQHLLMMNSLPLGKALASEAQSENMILFEEKYNYYANLAITRYQWSGLPDSVDERFLNTVLFCMGNAAFFFDDNLGYMCLPCAIAGNYNVYYEPVEVNAYSFNYNKFLSNKRSRQFVYMRNNPTATPTAFPVYTYVKRMVNILRTIDVLTIKMKQPYIISCDEKERLTYLNAIKKVNDNEPIVLGIKNFGLDKKIADIKSTGLSPDFASLWDSYRNMESILNTILGIENVAQEKRERLITDEVTANNMISSMSIETNIRQLQHDCVKINNTFNLDVWVEAKGIDYYRANREALGE